MKLGDIAEIQKGKSITSTNVIEGSVKVVAGGIDYAYLHNEANRPANIITVSASGANAGFVNYWNEPIFASDCTTILAKDELTTKYVFNVLKTYQELVFHLQKGSAQPHVYADDLKALQIPKAPLDVQNSIVTECEQIDGECQDAQKQIEKAKSEIAEIMETVHNSDAPVMELSSLIMDTEYGTAKKSEKQGKVPVIRMGNIQDGHIDMTDLVYSNDESDIEKLALKKYDVLFNRTNSPEHVGKVGIYLSDKPAIFAGYLIRIHYKPELIEPVYLCHILNSKKIREYGFSIMSKSINQANISGSALQKYKIPVPPLAEQQKIVAQISALEAKITIAKQTMNECPAKKQTVLNKWLR